MSFQTVKVICNDCGSERIVQIHQTPVGVRIDWLETEENQNADICSARERLDGNIGWQCRCGNNNLWTQQEARIVTDKVKPKPQEINEIIRNLEVEPVTSFKVVPV